MVPAHAQEEDVEPSLPVDGGAPPSEDPDDRDHTDDTDEGPAIEDPPPPEAPREVRFTSYPPGAQVALIRGDERRTLGTTPLTGEVDREGEPWTVEMSLAGHERWRGALSDQVHAELRAVEEDAPAGEGADEPAPIEDIDLAALLNSGGAAATASRRLERIEDAPAAVTVITRDQIRVWGYSSVAEVLERVVGFYMVDDHMIPNAAVRGITGGLRAESGLLKVMIDGRPVSFRPTGGNWLGPELIPLSVVERIEIVRGPTSTVYGADAFLGVINVITRTAERIAGGELWSTVNYGGGLGGGLDMTIGGRAGDFSALAALRFHRDDRSGLRLPDSSPAPTLRPSVDRAQRAQQLLLDSGSVFARVSYHIDSENTISLTGLGALLERNGEFADWLQLSTGLDELGRTRGTLISLGRGYGDISATLTPSSDVTVTASAGFFGGAPTDRERLDVGSNVAIVQREMDSLAGQGEVSVQWTALRRTIPNQVVRIDVPELQLTGGADFLYDYQTLPGARPILLADSGDLRAGDSLEEIAVHQGSRDFVNVGVFVLGTWNPIDLLRINAGVRVDYNNIYDFRVNGRVGASVRIIEELTVKVTYNTAFRAPTTQLLYGTPLYAGDILGNAGLLPQQIHTVEGNVSLTPWDCARATERDAPEPCLRFETALSYSYASDVATFVPVGVNASAENLAEIGIITWETQANLSWRNELFAYANVAWLDGLRSSNDEGYRAELIGNALPAVPNIMFNLGANYRIPDFPLRFGVEGRFIGERRASDANVIASGRVYTIPAAFYLDGQIGLVDLPLFEGRETSLLFIVRNILGDQTAHPGFGGIDYPSAPRTFMLQWRQQI